MKLTPEQQKLVISLLLSDNSLYSRAKPCLRPEYFSAEFQPTIQFVEDYTNKYNAIPLMEQVNVETGMNYVAVPQISKNPMQQQSVLDMVNDFCKTQALNLAVIEGSKRIAAGDTETIMDLIKEAQRVGVRRDYGINFWDEQDVWLNQTAAMSGSVKTGWNLLDDNIGGGFSWGELEIIASPSGGGKSLALANLGLSFSMRGYNVIYFTLELAKELVGKRIFSMHSGIPYSDLKGKLDAAIETEQALRKDMNANLGMFRLVNLPQRSSVSEIDSRVREMEIEFGRQFQIIIVDYADLMAPRDKRIDPNNINQTGKYIIEELRGWAKDLRTAQGLPTLCLTASQVGKDSMSEMDLNMNNLSGSAWKINTADLIFSVRTNKVMRENGKYELKILKNRNGGGLDNTFKISYNPQTLLMGSIEEMSNNKITQERYDMGKNYYRGNALSGVQTVMSEEQKNEQQVTQAKGLFSTKPMPVQKEVMPMETINLINTLIKAQ